MAVGARQSTGPLQIAEIDINLINDVLRQIQDKLDVLFGLTGQNLSVTVADASTIPAGRIVKAATATTLAAADPQTATAVGDYVAPHGVGSLFDLTANKVPKALTAKTLTDSNITDNGTTVAVSKLLDLSSIAAGSPVIKFTSTTDTPVVVFDGAGTVFISAAPAGYLEVQDGSNTRYIPFWL